MEKVVQVKKQWLVKFMIEVCEKGKAFVAMDCGSISSELAGSELFGHEKGSFTGAINKKIGHFELADGGTLF